MKETTPKVHLIAKPQLDWYQLGIYLDSVGGKKWQERVQPLTLRSMLSEGEALVEVGGRLCYRSWDVGLNPNVTKVRENSSEYLLNILKSKHGSVLEHANYSFIFQDVSRVFTHELVRHRAGVAISQESLRYVRLQDLGFRIPEILEPHREAVIHVVEVLEEFQKAAAESFKLDDEKIPFSEKKAVTSALRRLAPLGLSTAMLWTANIRTIRHVVSMRTAEGAEEEIRQVFQEVGWKMKEECPDLFQDFDVNSKGEFITPFWKV